MNKKLLKLITVILVSMTVLSVPVSAASDRIVSGFKMTLQKTNKNSPDDVKYWGCGLNYGFPEKASKLTSKNTYSATFIIPTKLLGKGNAFYLGTSLGLDDASIRDGDNYVGWVPSADVFLIQNNKGKVSVTRYNDSTEKKVSNGKVVKIKKSGKNYVLTIKNAAFQNQYCSRNDRDAEGHPVFVPLDLSKDYYFSMDFDFHADGPGGDKYISKAGSGYVFVDNLSIKAAKTVPLSIEDWNYRWFNAFKWDYDGQLPRRIAAISY